MNARGFARAGLVSGTAMLVGDATCQVIENLENLEAFRFDARRTAAFAGTGLLASGPMVHCLFVGLERVALLQGTGTKAILGKMAVDIATAPVRIGTTFSVNEVLSGRGVDSAVARVKKDVVPTWKVGVMVFPPVTWCLFRYIQPANRVPVQSALGVVWSIYMAWVANGSLVVAGGASAAAGAGKAAGETAVELDGDGGQGGR